MNALGSGLDPDDAKAEKDDFDSATTISLSNRYIKHADIQDFRRDFSKTGQGRTILTFAMQSSVLVRAETRESDMPGSNSVVAALHALLCDVSGTLKYIRMNQSNVSGNLFYKGKSVAVENPEAERVTLEGHADGEAVIRDDSHPPLGEIHQGMYYLKTAYIEVCMSCLCESKYMFAIFML